MEEKNRAVYIHIPFCKSICSYCDFCKFLYNSEWVNNYIKKLKDEIKERYMGEKVSSIYFGGGTPSCLQINEIKELLKLIKIFNISDNCEITFECNIEDINKELLEILKDNHVNRLSIGIQSFNQKKLSFMKRKVDFKDVSKKINLVRSIGIKNINVDLIYAIPFESMYILKQDIKKILKLNPEHISTYSLSIEKHTLLGIKKTISLPEEKDYKMYKYICQKLKKKGYIHYEVSNFSKKGYSSKHNLNYWDNHEYYGFGCGASGYIIGVRYTNTRNLNKYLTGYREEEKELLSDKSIMEYELMLGLRKTAGINLKSFYDKYHVNMQSVFPIMPLIKSKDLIYKKGWIMINPKKIYIMNEILLKLV